MSARTFDLADPAEYERYLEYAAIQATLYGGLYLTFDGPLVTVLDACDVQIAVKGDRTG